MTEIDRRDIQGNILDGYTFTYVEHLFACFERGRGKRALAGLIERITSASPWDGDGPASTLNVGLSHAGLAALGLPQAWLTGFPQAFRDGMQARAAELGDVPREYDDAWQREPVHLWLWIHARTELALNEMVGAVLRALDEEASVEIRIRGERLADGSLQPIEHFGFRDGVSQPSIVGSLKPAQPGGGVQNADGSWRSVATGEFVLGYADETGDVPELAHSGLTKNGTFAVFRKLEQRVGEFRDYLRTQSTQLRAAGYPHADEEWIAERMVGRRRDGTALDRTPGALSEEQLNAFNFGGDEEGRVCPLGSHIRRANPRGGQAFRDSFARHRILRRSIPYGRPFDAEPDVRERGILFVALNADIERQFEFLQRRYMNDGAAARQGRDADPLVGAPAGSNFVIPGDASQSRDTLICPSLPAFVVCRGGDYFLLPGLRALTAIQSAAVEIPRDSDATATRMVAAASSATQTGGQVFGEEAVP